ncbi:MBG domain-containing protein [Luteolibacter algae]|uniref:MBG domain-containing protein n=1 Tax=Luteolibacter algae TaxID=454151 RepID=A0ABW5D513_9BACT
MSLYKSAYSGKCIISMMCLFLLGGFSLAQQQVSINFGQLTQEYDGTARFPVISSNPSGVDVEVAITPRTSETVYQTVPTPLYGSYTSVPLAGSNNKALGDIINLGGGNRYLESIDVVLVNWAKASDWPSLAAQNSAGYYHTISMIIYKRNSSNGLDLLTQKSQQVLIPWRPEVLDDGTPYPFGGIAFKARFNFPGQDLLGNQLAVLVAYNTRNSGFAPTGVSGPYDALNVGLNGTAPTIGSDASSSTMLRLENNLITTGTFGAVAPMFTIRSFPQTPATGTAVNAGVYRIEANVVSPGYQGSAVADMTIKPAPVTITLGNLTQVANGGQKSITVTTQPSGISHVVSYAGQSTPPSAIGTYPVFVDITAPNYGGRATGTLRLGNSFSTWISGWQNTGSIPPSKLGMNDDPDLDGRSNFLEYAAGTNPSLADATALLEIVRDPAGVALIHRENTTAVDLTYRLYSTSRLDNPASWAEVATTPQVFSEGMDSRKMKTLQPIAPSPGAKFYRLGVQKTGGF